MIHYGVWEHGMPKVEDSATGSRIFQTIKFEILEIAGSRIEEPEILKLQELQLIVENFETTRLEI